MSKRIDIWIDRAEKIWMELLVQNAAEVFSGAFLPSHDHTHHHRVWLQCRKILREVDSGSRLDYSLVEGVLVAAFFHDLGLARTNNKQHGPLGREMCEKYFTQEPGLSETPQRFEELLVAIERHDSKDVDIYHGLNAEGIPDILSILSVADDMEAMGIIGIYRYTEIYLKRGIALRDLGTRILNNASARYGNISAACTSCPKLMEQFRRQYLELLTFFDNYNQQLMMIPRAEDSLWGHVGIVNYIRRLSVEGVTVPGNFLREIEHGKGSSTVVDYFYELKNELEKTHC